MYYLVCSFVILLFIFFFKQKTAYEVRISDWSSDVCSSDLPPAARPSGGPKPGGTTANNSSTATSIRRGTAGSGKARDNSGSACRGASRGPRRDSRAWRRDIRGVPRGHRRDRQDRKSTRLNSSH